MKNQLKIAMLAVAIITILGIANAQDNPDDNGKLWNLQSKNVSFAPHVGHWVTVSGTIPQKSGNDNDKADDRSPQNDLMVTKLDMVCDHLTP